MPADNKTTHFRPESFEEKPGSVALTAAVPFRKLLSQIESGKTVVASDTYATALAFYSWLKKYANTKAPVSGYASSRTNKALLATLSGQFFVRISHGRAQLRGAPQNPWLGELFPEKDHFLLRFSDFLGMNGAWQWFHNGILFPGLNHPIHPFYGVYFPTRYGHLQLFDQWLGRQKPINHALDMGTGCGVLSFYLLKHNCQKITATDINPPALKSLQYELEKHPLAARVNVRFASLFEGLDLSTVDLLVFNPPWIPEQIANLLDLAVHYEDGFFEQFFAQASEHLLPETLLVMPFSTFGLAAGITTRHPIAQEIKGKRFELIEHISQPLQQAPSKSRNWLANIRQNENDELWVLQKKSIRKL